MKKQKYIKKIIKMYIKKLIYIKSNIRYNIIKKEKINIISDKKKVCPTSARVSVQMTKVTGSTDTCL